MKKGMRAFNFAITVFCVLSIVMMGFSLVSKYTQIVKQKQLLAQAQEQYALLEEECNRLEEEVKLLDDENYITRYARKNWVFTKQGETVIPLPADASGSYIEQ